MCPPPGPSCPGEPSGAPEYNSTAPPPSGHHSWLPYLAGQVSFALYTGSPDFCLILFRYQKNWYLKLLVHVSLTLFCFVLYIYIIFLAWYVAVFWNLKMDLTNSRCCRSSTKPTRYTTYYMKINLFCKVCILIYIMNVIIDHTKQMYSLKYLYY